MNLGPAEIGLMLLAVMLLFGYKKLPDASRSLGRSLRIFKGEMNDPRDDPATTDPTTDPTTGTDVAPHASAAVVLPASDHTRLDATGS